MSRKALYIKWAFPEKIRNLPVEEIQGNSRGGEGKVIGVPEGMPKFEEKVDYQGVQKSGEFPEGYDKIDRKSRGWTKKKSSTREIQFFFW